MKKQTIGRLFSLLMCATLAFTSVDLGVFAATDSENTEIVTEVSNDETEAEVTEESDTVVVSDEDTVVTTTEDADNDTTNNKDNDEIVIEDDEAENVFATTTGMTGSKQVDASDYIAKSGSIFKGIKYRRCAFCDNSQVHADHTWNYIFDLTNKTLNDNKWTSANYRDYLIPEKYTEIYDGALSGDKDVNPQGEDTTKRLNIALRSFMTSSTKLTAIDSKAFYGLAQLRIVNIRSAGSLTRIGSKAFANCPNLKYVILPDYITDISSDAFSGSPVQAVVCTLDSTTYKTLLSAGVANIYTSTGPSIDPATSNGNVQVGETPVVGNITRKLFKVITSVKSGKGSITAGNSSVAPQSSYAITSTPSTGYSLSDVTVNGASKGATSPITLSPIRQDYEVYAYFKANTYTITLNANGGAYIEGNSSTTTKNITATYDNAISGLISPTRLGYEVASWNTKPDGSGTSYSNGSIYNIAGNTTLYAQWKSDGKEYTVTLNPNGGTCNVTSIKVVTMQKYPALPVPTRSGYYFTGWSADADPGAGSTGPDRIKEGDTVIDIYPVLYAQWNTGSDPAPTPTPGPDNPTPTPSPDNPTPGPDDPNPPVLTGHSVTYILNGGEVPNKKASKLITDYEKSSTVLPKPKKTGYKFIGWFVGDVKVKKLGKNISVCNGDIKVEARFALVDGTNKLAKETSGPCGITYVKNGGTEKAMLPTSYQGRAKIKLPKVSKDGYTFLGWFANVNGNLVKVSNVGYKCGICDGGKNITLTAMFTPNQYIIKFNKNGGKGKMASITTYYDVNTLLPAATFEKGTMTVDQWYDKKNNTSYNVNSYVKNLAKKGSITLKANWILKVDNKTSYNSDNVSENLLNADEVSENSLN